MFPWEMPKKPFIPVRWSKSGSKTQICTMLENDTGSQFHLSPCHVGSEQRPSAEVQNCLNGDWTCTSARREDRNLSRGRNGNTCLKGSGREIAASCCWRQQELLQSSAGQHGCHSLCVQKIHSFLVIHVIIHVQNSCNSLETLITNTTKCITWS